MSEVYIRRIDTNDIISNMFDKDILSIEDLLDKIEELYFEIERIKEEEK